MPPHFAQALLDVLIFWILTTPHEFAHAWVATMLGDDTPRRDGRVTLNPAAHVDWLGTVIVPLATSLMGAGFLGWGRPVNTDPRKLRGGRVGLAVVALAGPLSNVVFAGIIALAANLAPNAAEILFRAAYMSIYLALFNLIPLPPLDGSKVLLAAGFPVRWYVELGRYGFLLLMVLFYSTGAGRLLQAATLETIYALFRTLVFRT
jgi:Zn-dependent protease